MGGGAGHGGAVASPALSGPRIGRGAGEGVTGATGLVVPDWAIQARRPGYGGWHGSFTTGIRVQGPTAGLQGEPRDPSMTRQGEER